MGASSPRKRSTTGPTGTGSGWTSAARASRWTTVTLKPSTEACGVSACRNIGSWTWTTPERSSPAGGRTTTTFDPTAAWVIFRPSTSGLAELSPPPPRGSKTHPRSGPKLGGGAGEDHLLHVLDLTRGEVARRFFPVPAGSAALGEIAHIAGFADVAVRADTIAAVFAFADTIALFNARGDRIETVPIRFQRFRTIPQDQPL